MCYVTTSADLTVSQPTPAGGPGGGPLSFQEWRKMPGNEGHPSHTKSRYMEYLKSHSASREDLLVPPPPQPTAEYVAKAKRDAPVGVSDLKIFL